MDELQKSLDIVLGYVRSGNIGAVKSVLCDLESFAILEGRDVSREVDELLFYTNFHAMINRLNDA